MFLFNNCGEYIQEISISYSWIINLKIPKISHEYLRTFITAVVLYYMSKTSRHKGTLHIKWQCLKVLIDQRQTSKQNLTWCIRFKTLIQQPPIITVSFVNRPCTLILTELELTAKCILCNGNGERVKMLTQKYNNTERTYTQ